MEPQSTATSRLVRRREGRMICGVCQGIAEHFNIDPLIVRIGFVITAFFGGAGAIAYGAAWLLIPEGGESRSVGERIVHEHRWGRIAGIALIVIAVSSLARPVWWFGGGVAFPILLIIGGIYLLNVGGPGRAADDTPVSYAPQSVPTQPVTTAFDDAPASPPPAPPAPPTAMSPPPPPMQPRRHRGGIGLITLGLLFVGAGIVGLVAAAGNSIEPTYVFATGLIVVGLALVISTWIGRSFLLIPLGLLLVGLMSVSTVIDVPFSGGIGHKRVEPLTLAELHDEYHLGIGELRIDLSHLTFERGATRTLKATVAVGHLMIIVPRQVTAEVHGHAGMGELHFLDTQEGGVDVERSLTLPGAGESPARLIIEGDVGIGQVEVQDAAS